MLDATTHTTRLIRIALEKAMTRVEADAYNISRRNAVTARERYARLGRA